MNNAQLYLGANPMQMKDAQEFLSRINKRIKWNEDETVLDIGSGPGNVTTNVLMKYVPKGTKIVGSDVSAKMVEHANRSFNHLNVEFRLLDIENHDIWNSSWEKEYFDKIFSFYCLHWIQNQMQAAQNMYTLLKPGGDVFLLFLGRVPVYTLYESLSEDPKWRPHMKDADKYISPFHTCTNPAKSYKEILESVGFKNVVVSQVDTTFVYPSKSKLIESILAVNPFYDGIPMHLRNAYVRSVEDTITSQKLSLPVESGKMEVSYTLIYAKGTK